MWRIFCCCQWQADLKLLFCLFPVPTSFGGLQLYKAALGNCFEIDEWGPIEFSIMAKHFDRQGKPPYAYHAVRTLHACLSFTTSYTCLPLGNSYFVRRKHPISYVLVLDIFLLPNICMFDVCFLCVFVSAISGTPPLPWAAWRKRLNAGCVVDSMHQCD